MSSLKYVLRACISGEVSDTHFYFQVKWIISMFTCTSVSNIQTRAKSLILFFSGKRVFWEKRINALGRVHWISLAMEKLMKWNQSLRDLHLKCVYYLHI